MEKATGGGIVAGTDNISAGLTAGVCSAVPSQTYRETAETLDLLSPHLSAKLFQAQSCKTRSDSVCATMCP